MTPSNQPSNLFTPIFVVLFVQVIMLMMLLMNLAHLSTYEQGTIENLPPTNFLYLTSDTSWIGAGRSIAHIFTAATNAIIGALCIWYGLLRKINIIRYISVVMGLQFFTSAFVNISIMGVISFGGWWHFAALAGSVFMAVSSVATVVTFCMLRKHLRDLGQTHDVFVARFQERTK